MDKLKILFISTEITPYHLHENSNIANSVREIIERMYDLGYETRNFMPKFGYINERRHQLHEVIRLSGINIIVNNSDQPLVIKVASIPQIRVQVYFIDSEEFFSRKFMFHDETGQLFPDNDERFLFYIKGVLDSVRKLGWAPDIVHCSGWFSSIAPYYIKTQYQDDPLFSESKVIFSLFQGDAFTGTLNKMLVDKMMDFIDAPQPLFINNKVDYYSLLSCAVAYSDAVMLHDPGAEKRLLNFQESREKFFNIEKGESSADFAERVFPQVYHHQSIYSD